MSRSYMPDDTFLTEFRHFRACGYTLDEIATVLGIQVKSVERRLQRMRKRGLQIDHLVSDACTVLDDADAVGEAANAVTVAVREMDPSELHRWITTQCELRPARMAQVMMALGAWVNIEDETTVARGDRIESLSMPRRSA
ncbi:sigma factor-like helix-turn-helix DNA-binding protein [Antrihabitans spumae]|uniref:Sigma factor-like helix-turn-helix DNA-binding protein n=1 Tax=Antrihabitans spumae TaxID=3373370 RepID=A0ABW7KC82_9NOCA